MDLVAAGLISTEMDCCQIPCCCLNWFSQTSFAQKVNCGERKPFCLKTIYKIGGPFCMCVHGHTCTHAHTYTLPPPVFLRDPRKQILLYSRHYLSTFLGVFLFPKLGLLFINPKKVFNFFSVYVLVFCFTSLSIWYCYFLSHSVYTYNTGNFLFLNAKWKMAKYRVGILQSLSHTIRH